MYLQFKSIIQSKKLWLSIITTAFLLSESRAQLSDNYKADIELQAIGTTNAVVPFWMRANQFGAVPLSGLSGATIARISKSYSALTPNEELYGKDKLTDWGFGFEGRGNAGKNANLQLIEAYVKGKFSIFQLKAGRSKDVVGMKVDTSLSTGNFSVSGNALGIPKIEISIPEFWRVPIFDGLFSIKGTFSHGWLGHLQILTTMRDADGIIIPEEDRQVKTYFHQKSLYGRLGRRDWKLNVYGGFNHQVFWGNESKIFGEDFGLSPLETLFYVTTGKAYGGRNHGDNGKNILRSKIGNHMGSVDLGFEYDFGDINLSIYRQNFYDVGALGKLANIRDGLNGIKLQNNNHTENGNGLSWKKFIFELFFSKNQAGETWSPFTRSGDENYYNNYIYAHGWTYNGLSLGNPLITRQQDAVEGLPWNPKDFYINNRVVAFHVAFEGSYKSWDFLIKSTYSTNYGTFATSPAGRTTGFGREEPRFGLFGKIPQFSLALQTEKKLSNGYATGFGFYLDQGKLLNNSTGLALKLRKAF